MLRHDGTGAPEAGVVREVADDDGEREREEGDVGLRDDFGGIVRDEVGRVRFDRPFAGGGISRAAETSDAGHTVERKSEGRAEEAEADDRDVRHAGTVIR